MKRTIRWKYLGSPAEPGVWASVDGRFNIDPEYMGTTRPQGYNLRDNSRRWPDSSHDTVFHAKHEAERLKKMEAAS